MMRRWEWTAALVLPLLLYLAVTSVDGGLKPVGPPQTDYYNRLVHGLLKGHLYLDAPVSPELLSVSDPYDPAVRGNAPYLHDASLYHHHYYIYFGVTPVWTLLLPFAWLTGHDLPIGYAVWLFVSAGYLCAAIILRDLIRRHFPDAGPAVRRIAYAGLTFGGAELTLLARHQMYELPIAAGSAFFLAALVCLFQCLDARRSLGWAVLGGLALGLAIGCRPFYLLGALCFVAPLFSSARTNGYGWKAIALAAASCAVVGLGLAAYNHARFGSVWEFGQNYQLSGGYERQAQHFLLRYMPFNLRIYLFAPLRWGRYFPFVHAIDLPPMPAGFGGWDWSYGIAPNIPFAIFALGGFAVGRRDIRMGIMGASAVGLLLLMCAYFGSVGRYLGDLMPEMAIVAAVGFIALARSRRWVAILGGALAADTGVAAILLSLVMFDNAAESSPRLMHALAEIANAPVAAVEAAAGSRFGPVELKLSPPDHLNEWEPVLDSGMPPNRDEIWMQRLPGDRIQFAYRPFVGGPRIDSEPIAIGPAGPHRLTISLGSLYPPVEHPFFWGSSAERISSVKRWLRLRWDDRMVWERLGAFADPEPSRLWLHASLEAPRRVAPEWGIDALPGNVVVVRPKLSASEVGRRFPVVTAGRPGRGDALTIEVMADRQVRFGYDHWSKPTVRSPNLAWDFSGPVELHVQLPKYGGPGELVVTRSDGTVLWQLAADAYPRSAFGVYPGVNGIGASTCEATLPL
ncbi:MAG TPA: hypothetical protein VGL42_00085 [Opitutaceae bacterium]|jgi:hypothetical protein